MEGPLDCLAKETKRIIDEYNSRYNLDLRYEDALEQIRLSIRDLSFTTRQRKVPSKDVVLDTDKSAKHHCNWEENKGLEYWLPSKRFCPGSELGRPDNSEPLEKSSDARKSLNITTDWVTFARNKDWLMKNDGKLANSEPPERQGTASGSLRVTGDWAMFARDKEWLMRSGAFSAPSNVNSFLVDGISATHDERVPDLYTFWVQYASTKTWIAQSARNQQPHLGAKNEEMTPPSASHGVQNSVDMSVGEKTALSGDDMRKWLPNLQRSNVPMETVLAEYRKPADYNLWLKPTEALRSPGIGEDYECLYSDDTDFEIIG